MRPGRRTALGALAALTLAALGCAPGVDLAPVVPAMPIGGAPADRVTVRNATTAPLTVVVNGAPAGLITPRTDGRVSLLVRAGPPYVIAVKTPSGTTVLDFEITVDDHRQVVNDQVSMAVGSATECGWVEVAYGTDEFSEPDPAAPVPTAGGLCP